MNMKHKLVERVAYYLDISVLKRALIEPYQRVNRRQATYYLDISALNRALKSLKRALIEP